MPIEGPVDIKTFKDIEKMPILDLTTPHPYSSTDPSTSIVDQISKDIASPKPLNEEKPSLDEMVFNTPEDMEGVLEVQLKDVSNKGDRYLYQIFSTPQLRTLFPDLLENDETENYDKLTNEEVVELFLKESLKSKFLNVMEAKSEDKNYTPVSLTQLSTIENTRGYLSDSNVEQWQYINHMQDIDQKLNQIVWDLDKSFDQKEIGVEIQILQAQMSAMKRDILKESNREELLNWFRIHLITTREQRKFSQQVNPEAKRRIRFWSDFVKNGYDHDKAVEEASWRRGL